MKEPVFVSRIKILKPFDRDTDLMNTFREHGFIPPAEEAKRQQEGYLNNFLDTNHGSK